MECLYAPQLTIDSSVVVLHDEEARHARALRLREGERLLLTNGSGLCVEASIDEMSKESVACRIERRMPHHGEYPYRIIVALGVLDNRERTEFALEKAVELGAQDFVPLLTEYSVHSRTKAERLQSKAIAAMKQSQRARLIRLHEPMSPEALLAMLPSETCIILADTTGVKPNAYAASTVCLCVGAEGGFSAQERRFFCADERTLLWRLAPARLRAETALLGGLTALTLFHL